MTTVEIDTNLGALRGARRGASLAFFGIPYAAAPVGALRFAAPKPATPWSGVRDATEPGPVAPQGALFAPGVGVEGRESEDCLTLNVYTPACDGARRPVLFFVHGGAFTLGAAAIPLYDGRVLAEAHDVVLVSANYRLGCLGFHVPVDTDDPTVVANAALLDVALALRWVQRHIARFGGDPGSVTIFGESAGATLVTLLLAHPPARGLFHRAIAQSAMNPTRVALPESGQRRSRALFSALGVPSGDYAQLRDAPLAALKEAQATIEADRDRWPHFFPVLTPDSLPAPPAAALLEEDTPPVPLLIGYNRDEWNLFDAPNLPDWGKPLAVEDAVASLREAVGDAAAELFAVYTASRRARGLRADARAICRAIRGDLAFRFGSQEMAARYAARQPDVYAYLFTYASPSLRGALGACHALELPFVFGTLDSPMQDRFAGQGPTVRALSDAMRQAWVTFARTGIPRLPDGEAWPRYDAGARRTVLWDAEVRVEEDPFGEERRAFPL